jgi:hypothetical protein
MEDQDHQKRVYLYTLQEVYQIMNNAHTAHFDIGSFRIAISHMMRSVFYSIFSNLYSLHRDRLTPSERQTVLLGFITLINNVHIKMGTQPDMNPLSRPPML